MFGLGPLELVVLALLGVVLFGKGLPKIGHSLGQTITQFRKGVKGIEDDLDGSVPVKGPTTGPNPPAPKFG